MNLDTGDIQRAFPLLAPVTPSTALAGPRTADRPTAHAALCTSSLLVSTTAPRRCFPLRRATALRHSLLLLVSRLAISQVRLELFVDAM